MRRQDLLERREDIERWISEGWSYTKIYKELKCSRDALLKKKKKLNITYKGNQGGKGNKDPHRISALEMIHRINNGIAISNIKLRNRLIDDGLKEAKCELCGASEWMDKPIVLELHHKDFNHYNSNLDNLQILCSNCHMQVHGYSNVRKLQ